MVRMLDLGSRAPCELQGCKNRPAPFPGQMYKVTKPGYFYFMS